MEVSAFKPHALAGLRGPTPLLRLQSDERLVALTRRGNQAAFETLVSRYSSRLLAFCRHMLNSREDAEDVLQEVFAASFNAMVADDRPINVRPWLYRIARNRSLNHLRRQTAIGVDSMDVHLAEHGTTTADKVHRREEFRQLVGDVQELPETQRTALLLREIDALSYDQIADVMETTVPSVKSLLVRARVSLAEMSEARKLTCEEVRLELGEVAEGLKRTSAPVRRHLKTCDRCSTFRRQLKETNKALAAVMPVAPLLFLKKFVLAQLGTTASASGASAAAGAAAATTASAGAASALSAGMGTIASKTAATLAAAAIVTGAAVEVDHATNRATRQSSNPVQVAQTPPATAAAPAPQPVHTPAVAPAPKPAPAAAAPKAVAKPEAQPTTTETTARSAAAEKAAKPEQKETAPATTTPATTTPTTTTPTTTTPVNTQEGGDVSVVAGTPTTVPTTPATTVPATTAPPATTPPATTTPPPPPAETTPTTTEPPPPAESDPAATTPVDPALPPAP
ncbi:RNA polymerase sigma factor [Capillimicrobium parvum]|uniref:RNA polymerase sigma factor n=1 Tax=Capillimicrobium parvum TaxID=2884022 RepID=UPI00216B53AB|nr:RNA polymerase sigma factor [Capillimicrobium parvum]